MNLIPYFFAVSTTEASRSSLPASRKPPEIITAPEICFFAASSRTFGTNFAGTTIITKSILLIGTSIKDG